MKLKTYILIVVFAGGSCFAYAQKSDSLHRTSGYFSINYGYGLPIGAFADNQGTDYRGYALHGHVFNISVAVPIKHSHYGITFGYAHYSNLFDEYKYAKNYPKGGTNWYSSGQSDSQLPYYDENSLTLGIFYTTSIKNISFDFEAEGSVLDCSFPDALVDITVYINNFPWAINGPAGINASNRWNIGFNTNASIRYAVINNKIGIKLNVGFFYANAHYKAIENPPPPATTKNYISGNIPILILSFEGGLFYQFGR